MQISTIVAIIHIIAFLTFAGIDYTKKKNIELKQKMSFIPMLDLKKAWWISLTIDIVTGIILAAAVILGL